MFKTLDEQIEILRHKNLIINDEEFAKEKLLRENYFFISGYRHLFMDPNKKGFFVDGTTFEELYSAFVFDRKLRNIMFKYILIVENNIKSITSYMLSRKYGSREKDYLNYQNFTRDPNKQRQVQDTLRKMERQIRLNSKKHQATLHYINNYGYIPMWVMVKVLSLGILSELYRILTPVDQQDIAAVYKVDPEALSTYLILLSNFRNLCAHEDLLYSHRTQKEIPDDYIHKYLNIPMDEDGYLFGKRDLFALLIILKKMLSKNEFRDLIDEVGFAVYILDENVSSVSLEHILNEIGFPINWKKIIEVD